MLGITEELESLRRENARLRKLLKLTDAEAAPAEGTQVAWFERSPGPVIRQLVAGGEGRASTPPSSGPPGRVRGPVGERAIREVRVDARGRRRLAQGREAGGSALPAADRGGADRAPHRRPSTSACIRCCRATRRAGSPPTSTGRRPCSMRCLPEGGPRHRGPRSTGGLTFRGRGPCVDLLHRAGAGRAARQLGTGLVREAIAIRGRMDLRCYDRLFPSQDLLPSAASAT